MFKSGKLIRISQSVSEKVNIQSFFNPLTNNTHAIFLKIVVSSIIFI